MADPAYLGLVEERLPFGLTLQSLLKYAPARLWEEDPAEAFAISIGQAGIFDSQAYLEKYKDVARAGADPIRHFAYHGLKEKRHLCLKSTTNNSINHLKERDKNKSPKVTILVPVFNNALYLCECFDSLLNQTLNDIEIILLNDGSTEPKAIQILNQYEKADNRVILINKDNSGYGHTMNIGLNNATGQYIAILESDDYLASDACEYMYNMCEEYKLDYIKTDFKRFYGSQQKRSYQHLTILDEDHSKYNKILDSWSNERTYTKLSVVWNGLYNADFINRNNIRFHETPGASFQDNGFWFQTYIAGRRFMLTHKPTYYLRRDNIQSSVFNKNKGLAMLKEFEFIKNILLNKNVYDRFKYLFNLKKFWAYEFILTFTDKKYLANLFESYKKELLLAFRSNELSAVYFDKEYPEVLKYVSGKFNDIHIARPVVSIIIPAFNVEKYIEESLKCLQEQTFKAIEIICIDDGSTDNTNPIVRQMAWKDKRIKLFWQPNAGAGNARNTGFKNAIGDFVMFLDADDLYAPTMVATMLSEMQKSGADFCVCKAKSLDMRTGKSTGMWYSFNEKVLPDNDVIHPCEIRGNVFRAFVGWPWDKMYKKSFLDELRLSFQEISSANDLLFVYAALAASKRIALCRKELVTHREYMANTISTTREKNPENFILALKELKNFLIKNGLYSTYLKSFISYAIYQYNWQLKTLKGLGALKIARAKKDFIEMFDIADYPKQYFYDQEEVETFYRV